MMVAILIIIALILPRLLIFGLWLFSGWFDGVFLTWYWPLLGFFCMPHTLLWYSAVYHWFAGQWDFPQILVLILAVMMDLGVWVFNRRRK